MRKRIIMMLLLAAFIVSREKIDNQVAFVSARTFLEQGTQDNGIGLVTKENVDIAGRHYEFVQYYRDIEQKKIRLMSLKTKEDTLIIPSAIDGEPVEEVGMSIYEFGDNKEPFLPWQLNKQQVLKKIIISEGIKRIVMDAFCETEADCIELPKSLKNIGEDSIHSLCFYNSKIRHVIIKGSKTNISGYVFLDSGLKKISLPKNYQGKIGSDAFENSKLEEFKWPAYKSGATTKVDSGVFKNCKNLKKVTFPKNQKHIYIPNSCFYGCKKLKKLTFPASTKKVTYDWTPYADNYKMGPGTLVFKGKKTAVAGVKYEYNKKRKWKVLTVGKIIAPKNSKALAYAKKAKRVKWFAKRIKTDIKRYTGPEVNYVDEEYNPDYVKLAKMKYSILKK